MTRNNLYSKVEIHAVVPRHVPGAASPSDAIRMWVGVFDADPVESITWSVNGIDVPTERVIPIRPLAPIPAGDGETITQSGIFEITFDARPGGISGVRPSYEITARATWARRGVEPSAPVSVRPLPDKVPTGFGQSFNVLLVSCFYEPNDSSGKAGKVMNNLACGPDRPDLVLTVGDQVYLDNPWWSSHFQGIHAKTFAKNFEKKYRKNWQVPIGLATSFGSILRAAPVAAIPDDHEYWNNYPAIGVLWPGTFVSVTRNNWAAAARDTYDAFQHGDQPTDSDSYSYAIDVAPLSFFMLDTRTFRHGTLGHMRSMLDSQVDAYENWIRRMLDTASSVPILVTGPSLFQDEKGKLARKLDLNFANLVEYRTVMNGLLRLSAAGRTPLTLTGDVHYPRLSRASNTSGSSSRHWAPIYEVVSSPTSLVHGKHSISPTGTIPTYDTQVGAKLACEKLWPPAAFAPMGNHVALLKFTRLATGVRLAVRYYPIGAHRSAPQFFDTPHITLRNAAEAQQAPPTEWANLERSSRTKQAPQPAVAD